MKINSMIMILAMAVLSALAACADSNGYYDANGHWVDPAGVQAPPAADVQKSPTYVQTDTVATDSTGVVRKTTTVTTLATYDRAGIYDANGTYIDPEDGPTISQNMYPQRGMCRVWIPHRVDANQPGVEPCDGIRNRVPAHDYVIYGG